MSMPLSSPWPRGPNLSRTTSAGVRLSEQSSWPTTRLNAVGEVTLPAGLTPHKLRHTFASILVALGVDTGSVMDQLGHTDPGFTLRVYRHGMRRGRAERERLRTLISPSGEHDNLPPSFLAGYRGGLSEQRPVCEIGNAPPR